MKDSTRRTLSASGMFFACLVILICVSLAIEILKQLELMDFSNTNMGEINPYTVFTVVAEIAMLIIPMAAYMLINRRSIPMMRLRNPGWGILLTPVTAFVGCFFVLSLTLMWSGLLETMGFKPIETAISVGDGASGMMISLFVIAVVPAIFEELAFRGMILPAMGWAGKIGSIALSGLLFAMMHGSPSGIPAHMTLGLVMGYLALASGSIWVPMLYHFIHNGISVVMINISNAFTHSAPAEMLDAMNAELAPMQSIITGATIASVTGVVFGLLLWLSWRVFRKPRAAFEPVEREYGIAIGQTPHPAALLPLLGGYAIVQLLYLSQYMTMLLQDYM